RRRHPLSRRRCDETAGGGRGTLVWTGPHYCPRVARASPVESTAAPGKDRDDFHHAQSRNVERCFWVRPQAVHLRSPNFWMVVPTGGQRGDSASEGRGAQHGPGRESVVQGRQAGGRAEFAPRKPCQRPRSCRIMVAGRRASASPFSF